MDRFRLEITPLARELQAPAPPGGVLTTSAGNYQALFKGTGLDFRGFREYAPMDDAKKIDWKASLRGGSLVVREYEEERNAEVLFCCDVSSGMVFGSNKLKNHYGAEFITSLGKHVIEADNSVGLVTFNNKITNFISPDIGEQQVAILMDILSAFSTYGGKIDFKIILDFLENRILEGTVVILVSDFFNFRKYKKYEPKLRVLRAKFELIFVMIRDPIEEFLNTKQKQVLLIDPKTGRNILISLPKIKKKYAMETKKEKERFKEYLKNINIPLLELHTDKSFVEPLYEFFMGLGKNS